MVKDSFTLSSIVGHSNLHQSYLVSYDVVSLFTNIPVQETINVIMNKLYPRTPGVLRSDMNYMGINSRTMRKALKWCLCNQTFTFDGSLYKQVDGCAMGSPLAPHMADIFMNHVLERKINNRRDSYFDVEFRRFQAKGTVHPGIKIQFFGRYVDDTLVAVNSERDAELFLEYLNGLHHCVKFTMEKEDSGILPFLDILIKRLEDGISTTIYRKKTHSGVYSHYKCFIPEKFKRTLVYTLVDRAWKICSTYQLWHREISYLKTMLMSNGYTRRFIEFQVHRYLSTIYDQNAPPPKKLTYGPDKLRLYIRLPYLGAANHKLEGCIRTCFKRIKAGGFQLVVINKYSRLKDWFGVKDRTPKLMRSNVVYKLECS